MYDIIVVGSATQDVFLQSSHFTARKDASSETGKSEIFPLGSKIEVEKIAIASGGGGTNTAVTFGRQGLKVALVGVVGNDVVGREIIDEMKREGVDADFVQSHNDDLTAYSVILVDQSGERTILSYKGEGQHFGVANVPFDKLQTKWIYLDSLGGHYDLFEALVNHAVKNNIKIASNPGGKELAHGLEKLKPFLKHMDIFIANKEEAAGLFGLEDPRKYVKGIISISDGPRGVTVTDEQGVTYTAGIPDSPVVERTGAGDAFGSGFVSEFMRQTLHATSYTLQDVIIKAIQFGTANASSVVTLVGSKAGILKKGDWGPWELVEVIKHTT
ncbi:MAG: hypothetical protein A3A33_02125 [Candidatus Yanofskybacteria bacterium RIFCSPLOWO2_01_FULL_49_25]|uniref:Carbohydrate kinase PfkB domain-containing protein n=1 Tax=Candidatus Yanofskybacteria bacterium RIFCSPLOWO2_01_FULL_49_25 TaxID=1802701 RepID=A0A1F8GUL9_9BACT|nr:MAG: hypothetical protein A3A33_02125 [Candidatus Yanofskybacteria bacterium RIFCSPLOWO2_01_FULL_49_25]